MASELTPVNDQQATANQAQTAERMSFFDRARVATVMLASGMAVMATVSVNLPSVEAPAPHTNVAAAPYYAHQLPPDGLNACPLLDVASMKAAAQLIEQPPNPDIKKQDNLASQKIDKEMGGSLYVAMARATGIYLPRPANAIRLGYEGEFKGRENAAKKFGVHIYDSTDALVTLNNYNNDPNSNFDDFFAAAQKYLKNFGVDLQVGNTTDEYADDLRAPTLSELQTNTAKMNMFILVEAFSTLPQEYIDLSGLEKIIIAAGPDSTDGAYATGSDRHSVMVLNTSGQADIGTIYHEIWHMVDGSTCGGGNAAQIDPTYAQYNNGKKVYGNRSTAPTIDSLYGSAEFDNTTDKVRESLRHQNYRQACIAILAENALYKHVSLLTDYSRTNIVEDKAEIGKYLPMQGAWIVATSPLSPQIFGKFETDLGRVYYYSPEVAEYFAAIANRQPFKQCNLATANANTFGKG
ncbi:MAG TPA: hypothetical protein VLG47_06505 [Candidatus Saccharimonadales bacterium]|nr:hypothetical protein [Candidatus Saccharimonadales bacterium]